MASHWSSDLVVFQDREGHDCIAGAFPTGTVFTLSAVKRFRASGPLMPLGWPSATRVGDAVAWMSRLTAAGFTFRPA